jgi:hypothetical protein
MNEIQITRESLAQLTPDQRNTLPNQVASRLLGHGGELVVWEEPAPDAAAILERGHVFDHTPLLRQGLQDQCHRNVALRWETDPGVYTVATGYALRDRVWRQHTWLVAGPALIETTTLAEVYYGWELTEEEAVDFWLDVARPDSSRDEGPIPIKVLLVLAKYGGRVVVEPCSAGFSVCLVRPRHEHVGDDRDGGTRPRSPPTR